MKGIMFVFGLISILVMGANDRKDLNQLQKGTTQFQRLEAAQAAGYGLMAAPIQCVQNSSFGGQGYRFVNAGLIDGEVDFQQPEALIYIPSPNGTLRLGAVEYIVPVAAWNARHTGWPQLMGNQFHLNPALEAYVLHVWVWEHNPSGMFEDWNPNVSCR